MRYSGPAPAAFSAPTDIAVATYHPEGCRIWFMSGFPVISVPAEVNIVNDHLLRNALLKVCTGTAVVIVDMTSTSHFSAAGIGALVTNGKRLRDSGGELRLVVGSAHVQRVLEALKIDQMLPISSTLAEALASDRRDPLPYAKAA